MESAFRATWTRFLLAFVVLTLLGTVWAQGTGEVTGLVTDPSGAVISDAMVTLTNSATAEKRTTVTSSAGIYRFPGLPIVGTYVIQVALKGFKSTKIEGIVVSVGTVVTKDLKLELGAATEQVTVEAGAETVQTSDSSVSQLVDRRIWQQAPLEVRNQNSFIELVAGAVSQDGTNNNRGAAVNGAREGAGSYLVEGTDNNDQGQGGRGQISNFDKGGAATSISPDAIQEYRVITNSFSAEYGKGGGFITDTVLKSGTNQWHGSAFEYNRMQALAANDYFSNKFGVKDRLVRNQFGGSLGGPIVKDKTFFYGSAEFHRLRQTSPSSTVTATTQEFLDFVNSGGLQQWAEGTGAYGPGTATPGICLASLGAPCPGAFALSSQLGPIFSAIKALPGSQYPLATQNLSPTGQGIFDGGLTYPVNVYGEISVADPTPQNELRWSLKFDHRFSDKDSISAVYLFQDATFHDKFGGGNNTIGPAYTQDGRGQNYGITWNHTFSPSLLNTYRMSYLRHRVDFPAPGGVFGAPGYSNALGDVGVDLGIGAGLPQFFTDTQFQYVDTMSYVHGKHSFKYGGEYRRTRNGSRFYLDTFSTVVPWTLQDTVTDLAFTDEAETVLSGGASHYYGGAYEISAAINPTNNQAPDAYRGFRANEFAGFVQDDWRVSNRFTVNLGVRWEYFGPPHNFKPGIDSNVYFGTNVTPIPTTSTNPFFPTTNPFYAGFATATFQVRNHEIWNKDTNNWGPRVGFAWDVFGTQKIVVRAGAGIMYDRIYNNVFENIRFNPPYYSDNQIGGPINGVAVGAVSSPGLLTYPFTSQALFNSPLFAPLPNPRHMNQDIVTPYYEQVHFGLQWEFAKGYVFEPEYVGTFGHKLLGLNEINTFDGRTASGLDQTRINPNIGQDNFRNNGFSSNYHGLQLSVRKNYATGLNLNANYTYSKSLDDDSDLFNSRAGKYQTDTMNAHYDYGPSDFDVRHRFVTTIGYELPFMKQNRWIGGWGVDSIIVYQTGHPFSPYSSSASYDLNKDGNRTDRLIPVGSPSSTILSSSPASGYFDKTKWVRATCPATVNDGLWCNAPIGRNALFGPAFANVDLSLRKKFKINERSSLTFQAAFFDLANHPNFLVPTYNSSSSTFGRSVATLDSGGHRITQLSARFDF